MSEACAPTKLPMTLLSVRQCDVLALIASGAGNAEIAATLCITENTVKTHIRRILLDLQARNRAHAVSLGYQRGYLTLDGATAARCDCLCHLDLDRPIRCAHCHPREETP